MNWTTLVGTLAGAMIAMTSALLVEWRRDRRDHAIEQMRHQRKGIDDWRESRTVIYGEFLSALAQSRNEMRRIARDVDTSSKEKEHAARAAFVPCYGLRYQMEIIAPNAVVDPAVELFRSVRNLRDGFSEGIESIASNDSMLTDDYHVALHALRGAMREDLRSEVPFAES